MSIELSNLNHALNSRINGMVPAGIYRAEIVRATVETSKSDNPQIVYNLEIESGSHAGAIVMKFTQLTEGTIDYVIDDMHLFKISIRDMNDLPAILESLVGTLVDIEVSYREGYKYPVPRFVRMICRADRTYID
ncbi:MAG: hypothetical protein QG577_2635 [Thermodesulfobacteriota bacterium]|nr:hypothetical protein [Thermodesulfobacteriota bacterium]